MGNLNLKAQAKALYVNGNYAYVACSDGLHIVNVSIPSSPKVVGIYSFNNQTIVNVIVDGNYAYLASIYNQNYYCAIYILDVLKPGQPFLIGDSIFIGECLSSSLNFTIQKNEHYLFYCNALKDNLVIYDVSNPFSPQHKITINPVEKFMVKGNFAYTIYKNNLKILNIANPNIPEEIGTYNLGYDVENIYTTGNYLYRLNKPTNTNGNYK